MAWVSLSRNVDYFKNMDPGFRVKDIIQVPLFQPSSYQIFKNAIQDQPGILSVAQEKALENVASETLSQLIGPPGTGKSYTIACMALERFLAGESILIVSENEHAVDVIQEKLVEQLGVSANAIVRAGNKNYHKQLVSTIENLTRGFGIEEPACRRQQIPSR